MVDTAALFEFIKHGDDDHQAWLREAIEAFAAGLPKPAPRGLGKHGAKIAELELRLSSANALLKQAYDDDSVAIELNWRVGARKSFQAGV